MEARKNIKLVTSAEVTSVRQDPDSAEVFTRQNNIHGPFDLVVDSPAQARFCHRSRPSCSLTAQYGVRSTGPTRTFPKNRFSQRYVRASRTIGVLLTVHISGDNDFKAALFWSLPHGDHPKWRDAGLDAWKVEAAPFCPPHNVARSNY